GHIALPKGHVEAGEVLAETAIREIAEETGIQASIAGWLGSTEFRLPPDPPASPLYFAAYFLATGIATRELDAHLASDTILVPIEAAVDAVTIPAVRDMVRRAVPDIVRLRDVRP
ncbi:MAG: NUDIX domain-containing protein, partial [Vicinamibacterales bacterium]